ALGSSNAPHGRPAPYGAGRAGASANGSTRGAESGMLGDPERGRPMLTTLLALHVAFAGPPEVEWRKAPTPPSRVLGEACYPSGLRVTVREDHRQPVVSI